MTEHFLHYLWQTKKINFSLDQLYHGQRFKVISFGTYNKNESGPDFFNAKIEIDGILWCGSVEMHLKSSDWLLHQHQNDPAYNNVILHVVLKNDIDIIQNGHKIPVLIIENYHDDDLKHFQQFYKNIKIPCASFLKSDESYNFYFLRAIQNAFVARIEKKQKEIKMLNIKDEQQLLYVLIAQSFGSKVNKMPFERLSTQLPLRILKSIKFKHQVLLINWMSGLNELSNFNDVNQFYALSKITYENNLLPLNYFEWKRKGVHPHSKPEKRIMQFIHLVNELDFSTIASLNSLQEYIKYIETSIYKYNQGKIEKTYRISVFVKDQLMINCFIPFFLHIGTNNKWNFSLEEIADVYEKISAENNHITQEWSNLGVEINSAYQSQALLELTNNACLKKQCLNCELGYQILKK